MTNKNQQSKTSLHDQLEEIADQIHYTILAANLIAKVYCELNTLTDIITVTGELSVR